jgi:N-formylglutamate deformylase
MDDFTTTLIKDYKYPILTIALHNGHKLRKASQQIMVLNDLERLREEAPYTGSWASISKNQIIVNYSRFEIDLNRPIKRAIPIEPKDAWGLNVWKSPPSQDLQLQTKNDYSLFYKNLHQILTQLKKECGNFVVYDLHSYNHLRNGPDGPPASSQLNPEVNIGTGTMDRKRWAPLLNQFMDDLKNFNFNGRRLDVRENVKFKGGYLPLWIHQNFADCACCIAVEYKKFFMDEWTGELNDIKNKAVINSLQSTINGVLANLSSLC